MDNKIRDQVYHRLSKFAYEENPLDNVKLNLNDGKQEWKIKSIKEVPLHDKQTGFDAVIYQNKEDIVIAFRGTQGDDPFGEGLPDIATDVDYVVRGMDVNPTMTNRIGETKGFNNQFKQADELVKAVKTKYPNKNISLTGHSLGGALASYAASVHSVEAVTFSSPSVVELLPKETQKKVEKGEFDEKIVNYIHPRDSIGAGSLKPFERHIGSSYYIGSTYELENGALLDHPIQRFMLSISKENFHSLDQYEFDKFGNINHPILTNVQTGSNLWTSPRYFSNEWTTIAVTPVDLQETAEQLSHILSRVEEVCEEAKSYVYRLNDIKIHDNVQDEALRSIQTFIHWFSERTNHLSTNLHSAFEAYVKADVYNE